MQSLTNSPELWASTDEETCMNEKPGGVRKRPPPPSSLTQQPETLLQVRVYRKHRVHRTDTQWMLHTRLSEGMWHGLTAFIRNMKWSFWNSLLKTTGRLSRYYISLFLFLYSFILRRLLRSGLPVSLQSNPLISKRRNNQLRHLE